MDKKRTHGQGFQATGEDKKDAKRQRTLHDYFSTVPAAPQQSNDNSSNDTPNFQNSSVSSNYSDSCQTPPQQQYHQRNNYHHSSGGHHHHHHHGDNNYGKQEKEDKKFDKYESVQQEFEDFRSKFISKYSAKKVGSEEFDDSVPSFVRLPHYPTNVFVNNTITQDGSTKQQIVPKWPTIKSLLEEKIDSIADFEDVLFSLHPEWRATNEQGHSPFPRFEIGCFKAYIAQKNEDQRNKIFNVLFPQIQKWVLELPKFFPISSSSSSELKVDRIPKIRNLRMNTTPQHTVVELTESQIVRLLSCAFFSLLGEDCHDPPQLSNPQIQQNQRKEAEENGFVGGKWNDKFPYCNFQGLMSGTKMLFKYGMTENPPQGFMFCPPKIEGKWDCLFNYFEKMMKSEQNSAQKEERRLQFVRHNIFTVKKMEYGVKNDQKMEIDEPNVNLEDPWTFDFRNWRYWTRICEDLPFSNLEIHFDGTIEDFFPYSLQHEGNSEKNVNDIDWKLKRERCTPYHADFANKFVGGGVLGTGCVQEEIRFMINTECIISRLFTEMLTDTEGLTIFNTKQFSNYTGYASSFQFSPEPPEKQDGIEKISNITVFDALSFSKYYQDTQFEKKNVLRELNKALLCFDFSAQNVAKKIEETKNENAKEIPELWTATGHWGCGAFNGDKALKSILQWAAFSHAVYANKLNIKTISEASPIGSVFDRKSNKSLDDVLEFEEDEQKKAEIITNNLEQTGQMQEKDEKDEKMTENTEKNSNFNEKRLFNGGGLVYFSFSDKEFVNNFTAFVEFVKRKKLTVGMVLDAVLNYQQKKFRENLFTFVEKFHT